MPEPEPWRWFVQGDLVVTAESNAVVIPVRRGDSEVQREEKLRQTLASSGHGEAANAVAAQRVARQAAEAADKTLKQRGFDRAARGLDASTGLPLPPPRQGQGQENP